LQINTKIVRCHTANSKPVKQEVNGTVILPPLVFPVYNYDIVLQTKVRLVPDVNFDIYDNGLSTEFLYIVIIVTPRLVILS
jgi:hypothetical protein